MAGDSLALQSRDEMNTWHVSVSSETVYWQRGVQVKVVAVSILAGFVRSSNYLYLAEKTNVRRVWTARVAKLDFQRGLSLW